MAAASPSLTFVVLRHVKKRLHASLWRRCVDSISRFHPDVPIVIIDDDSDPLLVQQTHTARSVVCVIQSEFPGAGELLPYHYFLQARHFQSRTMIFLHDSMYLKRAFTPAELARGLGFLWHFNPNPSGAEIVLEFCRMIGRREGAALVSAFTSNRWKGCFGSATIIDHSMLMLMESRFRFISRLLPVIRTRLQREALERIIGLITMTMPESRLATSTTLSLFGPVHLHPHFFNYNREATEEELRGYDTAVVKTWKWR